MLIYLSLISEDEDKSKFERIYYKYRKTMYYVAYRHLKDVQDAEDVVQQSFVKVIPHLNKLNENECYKTRAFIVSIVKRTAIDELRKRESMLSYDQQEFYIADEKNSPDNYSDDLERAFAKMPANYSIVLSLKFAQGHKDSEIAAMLEISEDNVRKRISRAKKMLAKLLGREDYCE